MRGGYQVSCQWNVERGGQIAVSPQHPNLTGFGETPEAAIKDLISKVEAQVNAAHIKLPPGKSVVMKDGEARK